MNKFLSFILIVLLSGNALLAQGTAKNTIRAGAGIVIRDDASKEKYSAGPAIEVEYQYSTSKYIGFTASAGMMNIHYGKNSDFYETFASFGAMVTPLPDRFRWIKIGAGFNLQHFTDISSFKMYFFVPNETDPDGEPRIIEYDRYYRQSRSSCGLNIVGRAYFIDSSKYEFFASYRLKTSLDDGLQMNNALLTLCFGIKF